MKIKKMLSNNKNHYTGVNKCKYITIHETGNKNNIDVIKFSELQFDKKELQGFYRINVLKYVTRFDRKNKVEDLEKAKFYINKLIELNN